MRHELRHMQRLHRSYAWGTTTKRHCDLLCRMPLRAKNCYIKRNCKKLTSHQVQYCFECDAMPCKDLNHLDTRYREHYGMGMVETQRRSKPKAWTSFWRNKQKNTSVQAAATWSAFTTENATGAATGEARFKASTVLFNDFPDYIYVSGSRFRLQLRLQKRIRQCSFASAVGYAKNFGASHGDDFRCRLRND